MISVTSFAIRGTKVREVMIEFDENPTKMAINPILTNLNYRYSTSISKYRETHEWVRDRVVILNTLIEIYAGEVLDRYIHV